MTTSISRSGNPVYKPVIFWFGLIALVWITFLLYAGGFTTSIRAGMAFLDWPLSNGSINPEGWLENEDMMAEHSHRLLGAVMGLLSIGLCVTAFVAKSTVRAKKMGVFLVILVVVQGVLGGLRVMLDRLNLELDHNLYAQSFAVAHGTLAQVFLCLLVAFVVIHSRSWIERSAGFERNPGSSVGNLGLFTCLMIVLQLIIGAVMRHAEAGLAISTFPLTTYGTFVPPAFNFPIAINFAHRVGAIVVTIAVIAFVVKIWMTPVARKALGGSAAALVGLLILQIYLGALTVWTVRNPHAATVHMLNGAFTLAFCWMTTFRCLKFRLDNQPHHAVRPSSNSDLKSDLSSALNA